MSDGWVAGLNGNTTNSAPYWVRVGLGLSLTIFVLETKMAQNSKNKLGKQ